MRNGDWTEETERQAENAIGYSFRDKRLLKQCFTHTTYANAKGCDHNERLEFLGDAVVGLYVTEELYRNTKSGEGKLTDLRKNYVSEEALNAAAEKAGLMQFLLVSGIFLDGGRKRANEFLSRFITEVKTENAINELQEYVQAITHANLPQYTDCVLKKERFHCTVSALGDRAEGSGETKQAAKTQAAKNLLEILQKRTKD